MRKLGLVLVVALFSCTLTAFAQEAPSEAVTAVTEAVTQTVESVSETVESVSETVETEPQESKGWLEVLKQVGALIIQVAGPLAILLVFPILGLLAKWFNLNISDGLKKRALDAAQAGIDAADAWARGLEAKPSGSLKFDKAMKIAQAVLGSAYVRGFTEDKLGELIERRLEWNRKNGQHRTGKE